MSPSNSVFDQYNALDRTARELQRRNRYTEAQTCIDQMITLVTADRSTFHEAEDRIRTLNGRRHILNFHDVRRRGAPGPIEHLRAAAGYFTPSVCGGEPCETLNPDLCVARHSMLSPLQQRLCVEKIDAESTALKIEAALAARQQDFSTALAKRRAAVDLHRHILALDSHPNRAKNHSYLEYWCFITEGYSSLLRGDFTASSNFFKSALSRALAFNPSRFFPNYFRDIRELQAHHLYIEGVQHIAAADFAAAAAKFQEWLNLNPDTKGKNDLRYDNITAFYLVCETLRLIPQNMPTKATWDELESWLYQGNIATTTWAIWDRLVWLRELSLKIKTGDPAYAGLDLGRENEKLASEWQLFVFEAQLLSADKQAGLKRETTIPTFLDIFPLLDPSLHKWERILVQNLKHLFLILADYEQMRYLNPPPEESSLPRLATPPEPAEAMSTRNLGQLILKYLSWRAASHKVALEGVLAKLPQLNLRLQAKDFQASVALQREMFEAIRSWPHVIKVQTQEEVATPVIAGAAESSLRKYRTTARRLWNREPKHVSFEGPQELEAGEYYYLRPNWNIKPQERIRIMHEQFHRSDVPRSIDVCFETLFGRTKIDWKRFQEWIFQFSDDERLLACQLLGMLKYYDESDVRDSWLTLYRSKLPPEAKIAEVSYVGLGHTAKSGLLNNYSFRQAMSVTEPHERSFEFKKAFREIWELDAGQIKPNSVVFVDDFIGTGDQAVRLLQEYLTAHKWLREARVYYCALVGFTSGINTIKQALGPSLDGVFVADELDEQDKAFAVSNPAWKDEKRRAQVEEWAAKIGAELLQGNARYDPQRDKLGWHGSQALVVFHYNIPNNTLPLFWAAGHRNSRPWKPLFDRYD